MDQRQAPQEKSEREKRLADALRANLRRRKAHRQGNEPPPNAGESSALSGGREET